MGSWARESLLTMDKSARLVHLVLALHYDENVGTTTVSRALLIDQTGISYKTLNKSIGKLVGDGYWEMSHEDTRTIIFTPVLRDEFPETAVTPLSDLVMSNSSLSGTRLLCALYIAKKEVNGVCNFSFPEVATALGLSVSTVQRSVLTMTESGEWLRDDSLGPHYLRADRDLLEIDRSDSRHPDSDSAPETDGNGDLPLYLTDHAAMNRENIRPFQAERNARTYAQQAYVALTPQRRAARKKFSVGVLESLYKALMEHASPEVADTTIRYQLEKNKALSLKFLRPVAKRVSRAVSLGEPPSLFENESETSGAYLTSVDIYYILQARHLAPSDK